MHQDFIYVRKTASLYNLIISYSTTKIKDSNHQRLQLNILFLKGIVTCFFGFNRTYASNKSSSHIGIIMLFSTLLVSLVCFRVIDVILSSNPNI